MCPQMPQRAYFGGQRQCYGIRRIVDAVRHARGGAPYRRRGLSTPRCGVCGRGQSGGQMGIIILSCRQDELEVAVLAPAAGPLD